MEFNPSKPFNNLPLLPPEENVETKAVLKKTIAAGREILYLNKGLHDLLSK